MLWCTTADRQERDRKGRKVQENTQKKGYESNIAWTNSALRASSSAIKRVTKGRIARMAQHRHFVPHRQSKSEWMDCNTSSANRWIANSALCASSGNQEMAIKKENIWADQYNANYTSDPLTNWPNQALESYSKVTWKFWECSRH